MTGLSRPRPHPMTGPHLVGATGVKGERSESAGREARLTAETETKHSEPGEADRPTTHQRKPVPPTTKEDDHDCWT